MGVIRFGLVGNYQAGKSTLINCLIERAIATIGDGTSTTHVVVNYQYGDKECIEQIDNNGNRSLLNHTDLRRLDSTQKLKEINVYINNIFLKNIILTDMPGFGKDKHDTMLSEETLNGIDFAIVVESNYKAIEENSDSYKNIERLKWHNIPYYIILNCADSSKKNWKWTPLYKHNVELASENIKCLNFYKPLLYPFEEGESVVVNLLWYWYSISHDTDDVIVRYQDILVGYNELTKHDKSEIFKFSNFQVVKKIFSMENRAYLELRKDIKEEIKRLKEELCPIGTIQTFAFEKIPQGWLICDGRPFKISEYPELYNVIGFTFGGKGTEFKVPDLRGQFIRGWCGDNKIRKFGSTQNDALQNHSHEVVSCSENGSHHHRVGTKQWNRDYANTFYTSMNHKDLCDYGSDTTDYSTNNSGGHSHDITIGKPANASIKELVRTANETRPQNIALMYCIKARS